MVCLRGFDVHGAVVAGGKSVDLPMGRALHFLLEPHLGGEGATAHVYRRQHDTASVSSTDSPLLARLSDAVVVVGGGAAKVRRKVGSLRINPRQ